jgi:Skp family chaperone for outer membrane proteins
MQRKPNSSSQTLVSAFVAAALGLSAGAALAQTTTAHSSRDEAAANGSTARHLTLTNRRSEQTLRYSRAHDLRICNLSGQAPSAAQAANAEQQADPGRRTNLATNVEANPTPVPLQVSYAGSNEQIQPGNCYDLRARDVRLSPAATLPAGSALTVSVAPVSGSGFVNGRTEAATAGSHGRLAGDRASKESVRQLTEEVKQEDREMRNANAELSRARTKLAQTTRELKDAQSKERHVASAERRTTHAERQEQQNAQPAQQNGATPQ